MKFNSENTVAAGLFLLLILYPAFSSDYNVLNMSYFLSMAFLSLSLTLIWGYSGIFSFGQTGFFGIGGYAYAMIAMNIDKPALNIIAVLLALIIAAIIAWILGWFMFYGGVNDVFVGLVTLCVTLVLSTFLAQTAGSQWKIGKVPIGGDNGINNIPPISFGFGDSSFTFYGTSLFYLILILLIAVYLLLRWMAGSKLGYSMIAIRENRERSKLLGYNIPRLQTLVFTLGGVLAALSGILYAIWGGYMGPSTMNLSLAALPVVLVAAAGRKNLMAAVIFTLIYYKFSQYLSASGSEYALIILGVVLVLVILLLPQGLIVTLFNLIDRLVHKQYASTGDKMANRGMGGTGRR